MIFISFWRAIEDRRLLFSTHIQHMNYIHLTRPKWINSYQHIIHWKPITYDLVVDETQTELMSQGFTLVTFPVTKTSCM